MDMDGVDILLGEIQDTMNMIGSFGKDEGVCSKDIKDSVNDKAKLAEIVFDEFKVLKKI